MNKIPIIKNILSLIISFLKSGLLSQRDHFYRSFLEKFLWMCKELKNKNKLKKCKNPLSSHTMEHHVVVTRHEVHLYMVIWTSILPRHMSFQDILLSKTGNLYIISIKNMYAQYDHVSSKEIIYFYVREYKRRWIVKEDLTFLCNTLLFHG